ncbi:MAG: alginate lyase family protein [Candidatus Sulfotelmatobacter sp.]
MGNWASRLRRLRSMDRGEIASRMRQFVTARADELRYRAGHDFAGDSRTVDIQPAGRFFFAAGEAPVLCALLQRTLPAQAAEIVSQAHRLCEHRFDLLGYSGLDYGGQIDWHLDVVHSKRGPRVPWFKIKYLDFEQVGDSKITWELNRHQHFLTLAKAYWLTGNEQFVREIFAQWEQWQRENPYPIGMNWASSLEVAFRCLSWIWTFFLLEDCPLFTSDLRRRWLGMLNLSGRHIETYLSTYFSPNTHLLGEALALFFLGTLFRLPSGGRWREQGWNVLVREAGRQVRADGFYFEQSTYYHVYALDMLLHARILAELNQAGLNKVAIPDDFDQTLQRMLRALALLSRAGVPPMFGDDDGGRLFDPRRVRAEHMLDPLATGAILYRREDFKFTAATPCGVPTEETMWLLGAKAVADFDPLPSRPASDSTALADSGFYLMADAECRQQLVMDAGPLGAGSGGHGHADALGVWLVRNGKNLLRDSGTLEYVGTNGERSRLRSTGAHNTLRVDGQEQAKSAGPFSWENFPAVQVRRWIAGQQFDLLEAEHDGYARSSLAVTSPVTHRRLVFHRKGLFWLVRDIAEGSGSHQLELAWHIGSGLSQVPTGGDVFAGAVFAGAGESLAILTAEANGWSREVWSERWSPVYGSSETAQVVRFGAARALPAEFVTLLIAGAAGGEQIGQLICSDRGEACASAYRYLLPDLFPELLPEPRRQKESHSFVFGGESGAWTQGAWTSDADFLYSHHDRAGRLCSLVLCNGTYADFDGERLISCDRRVSYAEVSRVNDPRLKEQWELAGPDAKHVRLGATLQSSLA